MDDVNPTTEGPAPMTAALPGKPSDPSEISFAPECFRQIGTETVYVVVQSALRSGPAEFSRYDEAAAFARRHGRTVQVRHRPIVQRIRWY